jgi:hypothetical protein
MDSAAFAELGATMRERNGSVENWLNGLSIAKATLDRMRLGISVKNLARSRF